MRLGPFLFVACLAARLAVADQEPRIAGFASAAALRLGERMYREGILPSGEPMQAIVAGSTPVDGRMFSCVFCHLRSGRGALEGTVIARSVAGSQLFEPLYQAARANIPEWKELPSWAKRAPLRAGYTDLTLVRAIREGLDPAGRGLHPAMPRYALQDRDAQVLVHYLRSLSATLSPGVTDTTLRFATVVSDDAVPQDREAMLATLQAFVRDHNSQNRGQEARAQRGSYMMRGMYAPYRRLELLRWDVQGPPSSWGEQLAAHYQREPVFALLGGITGGDWGPVHAFCEQNRIPALLPAVDFVPASEGDWYTVYFGRGAHQEAETAARYLHQLPIAGDTPVVQVFRGAQRTFASAFARTWTNLGRPAPENLVLGPGEAADWARRKQLDPHVAGAVLVLWLDPADLAGLDHLAPGARRPRAIFLSSTLLGSGVSSVPEALRDVAYLTHPRTLPQDEASRAGILEGWLRVRGIPLTSPVVQSKMYFLTSLLPALFAQLRQNFYRDFLLDVLDMTPDQRYVAAAYPRLSFGPGQRYASKGCYVVQLGPGPKPEFLKKSDWVVY
jgi:hypothetical protein